MMKYCKSCKATKPLDDFHFDKNAADGRTFYCKACQIAKSKAYYAANREAIRAKDRIRNPHRSLQSREAILIRKYGITQADYDRILAVQGNCCAICGTTESGRRDSRYMPVDHNHKTGKVRGILCHSCNRAVGLLGDDPTRVRRAADYLEGSTLAHRIPHSARLVSLADKDAPA